MHQWKGGRWGGDVFWWLVGRGEKGVLVWVFLPAEPMVPLGLRPEILLEPRTVS